MKEQSNVRNFVGVSIIATVMLTILLIGGTSISAEAATPYKVNADLTGVKYSNGDYKVTVSTFSSGKPTLEKSKIINTGNQICPNDESNRCYTPAGLFEFKADKVGKNTGLEICATSLDNYDTNCKTYKQTGKWPPTLRVDVPSYFYMEE